MWGENHDGVKEANGKSSALSIRFGITNSAMNSPNRSKHRYAPYASVNASIYAYLSNEISIIRETWLRFLTAGLWETFSRDSLAAMSCIWSPWNLCRVSDHDTSHNGRLFAVCETTPSGCAVRQIDFLCTLRSGGGMQLTRGVRPVEVRVPLFLKTYGHEEESLWLGFSRRAVASGAPLHHELIRWLGSNNAV